MMGRSSATDFITDVTDLTDLTDGFSVTGNVRDVMDLTDECSREEEG